MPVSVGDAGAARRAASSASGPPKAEVLVLMVACCWVVVGIVVMSVTYVGVGVSCVFLLWTSKVGGWVNGFLGS